MLTRSYKVAILRTIQQRFCLVRPKRPDSCSGAMMSDPDVSGFFTSFLPPFHHPARPQKWQPEKVEKETCHGLHGLLLKNRQ